MIGSILGEAVEQLLSIKSDQQFPDISPSFSYWAGIDEKWEQQRKEIYTELRA